MSEVEWPPAEVIRRCTPYANVEYPLKIDMGRVVAEGWKPAGLNYYERAALDGAIRGIPLYEFVAYEFFYRKVGEGYEIRALEHLPKTYRYGEAAPPKRIGVGSSRNILSLVVLPVAFAVGIYWVVISLIGFFRSP